MPKPSYWSFSSVSQFEQCPHRWYLRKVRGLPDPAGPAAERGNLYHELLERALLAKKVLTRDLPVGWVADKVKEYRKKQALRTEQSVFLNKNWENLKPTSRKKFARPKGTRLMMILDVLAAGFFADWKTGKIYMDKHEDQMHLYATGLASVTGHLHWHGELVYIDQEHVEELEFDFRADGELEEARAFWDERAGKMFSAKKFPKQPSPLCKWCPYSYRVGGTCDEKDDKQLEIVDLFDPELKP